MKRSLRSMTLGLTAALLLGAAGASRAQVVPATLQPADAATRARIAEGFGKMPLHFVENRGQLDARVAYYVPGKDKTIYFTEQGLTFALNGPAERWALKLDFVGARAGVRPEGQEPTGATYSYFKGPRSEWQAGLETYSQVVYRDLWPGIDLVYEGTADRMKYTFRVKPGADPDRIRLAWRGASGVALNRAGELAVTTPAGGFTDERPVSWQEANGRRVLVATKYRLGANGAYGFKLGRHDRRRELVIDPAVLVYAGFLGGSGDDLGNGIAVDGAGNAYVAGTTTSDETSFPVMAGPDLTHNGGEGNQDAFVAKVNAAGTALVYAGYIGGAGSDEATPVALCRNVTVTAGPSSTADASIDNGSFDPDAGDTITLEQSPAGPYAVGTTSVTLTVTDNHGDARSCTGTVTVILSPQDQIAALIAQIEALVAAGDLAQSTANPLINRLENADNQLDTGQVDEACQQLAGFIKKVEGDVKTGKITAADGQALIDAANAIRASLGCDVTCPCADPAVSPDFAGVLSGQIPISACFTEPFLGSTDGITIADPVTLDPIAFSTADGAGQWFCGPAGPGGLLPVTPEQGQYCASLLEQAANSQGVSCVAP